MSIRNLHALKGGLSIRPGIFFIMSAAGSELSLNILQLSDLL